MLGKTEKEKREVQNETVRQHHQVNGHEFELTPGVGEISKTQTSAHSQGKAQKLFTK